LPAASEKAVTTPGRSGYHSLVKSTPSSPPLKWRPILPSLVAAASLAAAATHAASSTLKPLVELEEEVYRYKPADNGAGPLWCSGSTCLVRLGDKVFASGIETLENIPPLNNCRWLLFHRSSDGWQRVQADPNGRTREPSPLAAFPPSTLLLSANPTRLTEPRSGGGPAQPVILQFSTQEPSAPGKELQPVWDGTPQFTEHSYRSFAADGPNRELILFQNIGYDHAEWTFRDRNGLWPAQGKLKWPWGADYDKPQPIRVCYPNVALKNRSVHFCGVSDITAPYNRWREFKKRLTGRDWDYDFRRLFYAWTPDITKEPFHPWIEIASRDKTCGWISPGDLWVDNHGTAHLLWTERALDERLQKEFFPDAKQSFSLNYARVDQGQITLRRTLRQNDGSGEIPSAGRFHITPDNRLFVIYFARGRSPQGHSVQENRIFEIQPDGSDGPEATVPLSKPFTRFFTATVRAGSPPSTTLDLLGEQAGTTGSISYARVHLRSADAGRR